MIVYLHSYEDRHAGRTFSRHVGLDVRHVSVPEHIDPEDIAAAVVGSFEEEERSAPQGLIDLLVINAKGGPGRIRLSAGEGDEFDINERLAAAFASGFAPLLKRRERGGQGVEIHGCGAAGGSTDPLTGEVQDPHVGLRFLYKLARSFDARVRASADPNGHAADEEFESSLAEALPSDDPDWEGHARVLRDLTLDRGAGITSRVEWMCGKFDRTRPAVESF